MDQVKEVPFHRLLPKRDSQVEVSTDDAPVCETKQRRLEYACSGLVLHESMTIFKYVYEQIINAIIDEVNDGLNKYKWLSSLLQ
jgi:hypothetical protein